VIHIGMLGDSIFDNGAYIGSSPDVRAQVQALLPHGQVTSAARDGAVMADIAAQIPRIPHSATHIVVSIGGNDAIGVSGVLEESAVGVSDALEKLAGVRDRFDRNYRNVVELLLARSLPVAFCTIYEPRFPDSKRRRAAATALSVLNDVITRQAVESGVSLIDLRVICDRDEDFANAIEPSSVGGGKIAKAITRFATGDRPATTVFGSS
jgi:GDSL-like Lipase/Acylhydrolase family